MWNRRCIRADTHRKNKAMQRLLRESGFRYRGNITISSEPGHDPERQCFEKILKKTGLEMDSKYLKPVRENGKPMKEEEES